MPAESDLLNTGPQAFQCLFLWKPHFCKCVQARAHVSQMAGFQHWSFLSAFVLVRDVFLLAFKVVGQNYGEGLKGAGFLIRCPSLA